MGNDESKHPGHVQSIMESTEDIRNERNYLQALLEHERRNFAAVESDRIARGSVIEEQGRAIAALHATIHGQLAQLGALYEERERERHERRLVQGVADDLMGVADGDGGTGGRDSFLASLRRYNHEIVDRLARLVPLDGKRMLDIGASPHGFAMERALRHRAAEYVGIGLDMLFEPKLQFGSHEGRLLRMNAERLDLAGEAFDAALSISAFEHIAHPDAALAEIHRVLRPGGRCLIVFEPIWTSSYGHHLHHFGEIAKRVPDWSHLMWNRDELARHLRDSWPSDAPLTVDEAVHWVYDGDDLNRIGVREMTKILHASEFRVDSLTPIREEARDPARVRAAAAHTGLSEQELVTRGLAIVLSR